MDGCLQGKLRRTPVGVKSYEKSCSNISYLTKIRSRSPNIILNNTMQNVCWCSKLLFVKNYCHTAAVSCNPNGYYLAGVQMGLGLTGEPGRAWCWCMGPCMGGCKVLP